MTFTALFLILAGNFLPAAVSETAQTFELDVSELYQPNFEHPRKYSPKEMDLLAQEVLSKLERKLGTNFIRRDPQHIWALAEFFALTPREDLDLYSTPMEEGDVYYFSQFDANKDKELYPQDAAQLAIRFYWEGLARLAALHLKLEVVNEKHAARPQKSRGKVSDIATTAMFDKKPGISLAEAAALGKEKYDFAKLIQHLKVKGLAARK